MSDDLRLEKAEAIGGRVRAARRDRKLSMRALAERIGTSQPFVSNLENGRIFPSLATLDRLARALDVPASHLLPDPERPPLVARGSAAAHASDDSGSGEVTLVEPSDRRLGALEIRLAPNERESRAHLHSGADIVVVIAGAIDVLREGQPPLRLMHGETAQLDGEVPHRLAGGEEGGTAIVVLAETGEGHRV